ncbi:glycoside hydrolase [Guyanagaster necrorhizus]|uniref:alpha-amylase n=1 Tax=Guyanagaster necrorhizus TaxID=856835 RepID=A0A9P7W5H4_9AGAR|nr:glycoside hydrolase [Guyanagaster necrorhizus MCA 3950]KAG7452972.1 glycoside hydrolase [Guyanagaster necrorhizus MCA 3950]
MRNSAGAPYNSTSRKLCGSSWMSITEHLDYIPNMGFDAIWISPIVANIDYQTSYGETCHGYWTENISSLNHHFGTPDDLRSLSSVIHARGIYLMVGVVVNRFAGIPSHMGTNISSINDFNLSPFPSSSDFHPLCWIEDYSNQTQAEQCWLGDKILALIDLDTEDPKVVTTMNDWISSLVQDYHINGIRIDTVKHIRKDFWPGFTKAVGVFSIGEVYDKNVSLVKDYTKIIDSVLDYPTFFALIAEFSSIQGNLSALLDVATASQESYKYGTFMTGSFLENHDVPRFQPKTRDLAQGYQGAEDPDNREALWLSGYATANKTLVSHQYLFNSGFLTTPKATQLSKPPLLTLLTNVGQSAIVTWNTTGVLNANQAIVDVLTCSQYVVPSDGTMTMSSSDGSPKVLMPSTVTGQICIHGENVITKKPHRYGNKAPLTTKAKWETFGITLFLMLFGWVL